MDNGEKGDAEQEKRNQDPSNYSLSAMSSEWRFCSTNVMSTPTSSSDPWNSLAGCRENLTGSSSSFFAPMVDSFGPPALWEQTTSVQNMGFCDIRGDISWNPHVSMLKEGLFLPNAPGTVPESVNQFPADSGFIERAARFSCFGGAGLGHTMNPFGSTVDTGVCPRGMVRMPFPVRGDLPPIDPSKLVPPHMNVVNTTEASKDAVLSSTSENCEAGQLKTEVGNERQVRSNDEQSKQVVDGPCNDSNEPEVSGDGGQDGDEETEFGSKNRKRNRQGDKSHANGDGQPAGNAMDVNETQQKIDPSPNSASGKAAEKNSKHVSHTSEPPKEEYIHVRARRGQATNSHSLAERVRREKISERMKFLQDLVPGCSKVTGKAVMLDEIINYVQSLQRQVEFLSMKLATVNPRLDFNVEGLLAKDILHSSAGPSPTPGFFANMPMPFPPPLHPPPARLFQAGPTGIVSPESQGRNLHNQMNPIGCGGSKESAQLPNAWEDELNNVVNTGFNGSAPQSGQDKIDDSSQADHAKVES